MKAMLDAREVGLSGVFKQAIAHSPNTDHVNGSLALAIVIAAPQGFAIIRLRQSEALYNSLTLNQRTP